MKKGITIIIALAIFQITMAQNIDEAQSLYSNNISTVFVDLPDVRPIYGGTKIISSLPDDWSDAQQGAFQYACELWEEVLPTTFPIRIRVNSVSLQQDITENSILSKVGARGITSTYIPHSPIAYSSEVKATVYMQMAGPYDTNYYVSEFDKSYFTEDDIVITYYEYNNKKYDDIYSFSRDAEDVGEKYDFTTCVLRDIAKGLGFQGKWVNQNGVLEINNEKVTPFMNQVIQSLQEISTNGGIKNYSAPTSGQLNLQNGYILYAPNPWDENLSLNCFIPTQDNALSQLLRWDFGRGAVCRTISDDKTNQAFKYLLSWKGSYAVGLKQGASVEENGLLSSNIVAYNGDITFNDFSITGNSFSQIKNLEPLINTHERSENTMSTNDEGQIGSGYYTGFKYHPAYRENGTIDEEGHTVAILKKDGTWDIVYEDDVTIISSLTISSSSIALHEPDSIYARNYDGHYRFRVSFTKSEYDNFHVRLKTKTQYYLVGALPQRIKSTMSKCKFQAEYENLYDEYTGVIKVGLNNLEGVIRVDVAQYDEGNPIPILYQASTFKDGYFFAVVDKEYDTRFVITAYNENGYTASEMYTFHPTVIMQTNAIRFKREGNLINVISDNNKDNNTILIKSANIRNLAETADATANEYISINKNTINIGKLKTGFYVLNVKDKNNNQHTYKFHK